MSRQGVTICNLVEIQSRRIILTHAIDTVRGYIDTLKSLIDPLGFKRLNTCSGNFATGGTILPRSQPLQSPNFSQVVTSDVGQRSGNRIWGKPSNKLCNLEIFNRPF